MLSMQSAPKSLFWRALLQVLLVEKVAGRKNEDEENEEEGNYEEIKENERKKEDEKKEDEKNKEEKKKKKKEEGVGGGWRVGKAGEKCTTFATYVRECLRKLQVDVCVSEPSSIRSLTNYPQSIYRSSQSPPPSSTAERPGH